MKTHALAALALLIATAAAAQQPVVVKVTKPNADVGEQVTITADWGGPLGNPWLLTFQYQDATGVWHALRVGNPPVLYTCNRSPCSYWIRSQNPQSIRVRAIVYNPATWPQGPPTTDTEPAPNSRQGWAVAQQKQSITWRQPAPVARQPSGARTLTLTVNGVMCNATGSNTADVAVTAKTCAQIPVTAQVGKVDISYSTTGWDSIPFQMGVRLLVGTAELPAGKARWPFWPLYGATTWFNATPIEAWGTNPCQHTVTAHIAWIGHPDFGADLAAAGRRVDAGNPQSGYTYYGLKCAVPITFVVPPPQPSRPGK